MKIVGISGRIGSGKTTIAKMVANQYLATVQSFATPIKEIGVMLGGSAMGNIQRDLITPFGLNYREFWQRVGTECFRDTIHEDVWVRVMAIRLARFARYWVDSVSFDREGKWFERISNLLRISNLRIVIDDVRFDNEIRFIESLGGVVIRLLGGSEPNDHVSETRLDQHPFSLVIDNHAQTPEETVAEIIKYLILKLEGLDHDSYVKRPTN